VEKHKKEISQSPKGMEETTGLGTKDYAHITQLVKSKHQYEVISPNGSKDV
jgi:hypothetical protein